MSKAHRGVRLLWPALCVLALTSASSLVGCTGESGRPAAESVRSPFDEFDSVVRELLAEWEIPGASVAIACEGRVVHAGAFGWADSEKHLPVTPDSVFRIASVSKPITAAAVLVLVDGGEIALNDKALPLLRAGDAAAPAPGLQEVTVEDLLRHTAGFDRYRWADSVFHETTLTLVRSKPGAQLPTGRDLVDASIAAPLSFHPGTRFAYSNLGYLMLGRLIEAESSLAYEGFVRQRVLAPAGIEGMRVGSTLPDGRAPKEVSYHEYAEAGTTLCVYDPATQVPWPDGGFHLPALDAAMGWVGTASELVRWTGRLFGDGGAQALLSRESLEAMTAPPKRALWASERAYYGLGWYVEPTAMGPFLWHNGTLPGSCALLARRPDGLTYAVLMNGRPRRYEAFKAELNARLRRAGEAIRPRQVSCRSLDR